MIRSLCALVVLGAACNPPTCGKGTKQIQKTDGTVECVPSDGTISDIDCDADAGATLVGGKCVSILSCGDNTKQQGNQCVGTGGMTGPHVPTPCMAVSATQICVNGVVRHLVDNSFLAAGETVRVWVVDPLNFLANPNALKLTPCPTNVCLAPPVDTSDTYTFDALRTPTLAAVVAVADAAGNLQLTGTAGLVVAGKKYQIDGFALPAATATSWASQSGLDLPGKGLYVARFFLDAAPDPSTITPTEVSPAPGVQLTESGAVEVGAKYFDPDFTSIGAGTMTSAWGAAIIPGTGDSTIGTFSGSGNTPGTMWEQHPGNTAPGVVFYDRFHPCISKDANGKCLTM
jgi:hypothetical protein